MPAESPPLLKSVAPRLTRGQLRHSTQAPPSAPTGGCYQDRGPLPSPPFSLAVLQTSHFPPLFRPANPPLRFQASAPAAPAPKMSASPFSPDRKVAPAPHIDCKHCCRVPRSVAS